MLLVFPYQPFFQFIHVTLHPYMYSHFLPLPPLSSIPLSYPIFLSAFSVSTVHGILFTPLHSSTNFRLVPSIGVLYTASDWQALRVGPGLRISTVLVTSANIASVRPGSVYLFYFYLAACSLKDHGSGLPLPSQAAAGFSAFT